MTILALLFFGLNLSAQIWLGESPDKPERHYTHLVIYQTLESYTRISGGLASPSRRWETKTALFESEQAAFDWLNSPEWGMSDDKVKKVRLNEGELIGLYDLRTAEQIPLVLKTEKKKQERKVEVVTEADEWEDSEFIKQ